MMGGGALLEGGVHWIDAMVTLGGKVTAVIAVQPAKDYPKVAPMEDCLEILFRFADGTIGKLLHSWRLVNRVGGLQVSTIYGTEGNIIFESYGVGSLIWGRRKKRLYLPASDLMGFRGMLRHFVACVREQRTPSMSLREARHNLEIVMAVYRSLESGGWEHISGES